MVKMDDNAMGGIRIDQAPCLLRRLAGNHFVPFLLKNGKKLVIWVLTDQQNFFSHLYRFSSHHTGFVFWSSLLHQDHFSLSDDSSSSKTSLSALRSNG